MISSTVAKRPTALVVPKAVPSQVQAGLSSDDQMRLFQALDLLQKENADAQQRTSSVMDAADREDRMVEKLRQLRQAQGQEIDEAQLRAAVRATREPNNLNYERTPDGVALRLVNVYLARAKWLPKVMVSCALALSAWGGVAGVSHLREHAFQAELASDKQALQGLKSESANLALVASNWPQGVGQDVFKERFNRSLSTANENLGRISAVLAAPDRDNIDPVETLISQSQAALENAKATQADAQEQIVRVKWASSPASVVKDPLWPEITARASLRHSALLAALETGNLPAARNEIAAIEALSKASSVRSSLQEAVSLVPAAGQQEAQALRARGEAALLNADINAANASISSLRALTDLIATSYTMKIVNEDGVKSGIWRYPNNNPNVKNYYVVVDALDASGNPVSVKVVNEETGKSETASRFAVRVSEAEYERVKEDKMDNGIIEHALVGTKEAGKMAPEFQVDTAGGGIITEW